MITARIAIAAVLTAAVARGAWALLDALLGESIPAQIVAVGVAVAIAAAVYAKAILTMRVLQARQIEALIRGRLPGRRLAPS